MFVIAIDTLIIPGLAALSKRVFSTAGNATFGKRNRLTDKNLEWKVLLYKNNVYVVCDHGLLVAQVVYNFLQEVLLQTQCAKYGVYPFELYYLG